MANPSDPNTYAVSADEIIPGLWLGNQAASQSLEFLRKNKITVVVNATKHIPNKHVGEGVQYYQVQVNDPGPGTSADQEDVVMMSKCLPIMVEIIDIEKKKDKNILVHCHAGMQRSATIVAAYLMKYGTFVLPCGSHLSKKLPQDPQLRREHRKLRKEQAVKHVVKCRSIAFNEGRSVNFAPALRKFAAERLD